MTTILHDTTEHKFYIEFPEGEASLKYTVVNDKTLDFYSTFVPPELRSGKIAQMLVTAGFDYAKANHYDVIPSCPYVRLYLERYSHE